MNNYQRVSSGINIPSPVVGDGFGSPNDAAHTPPGILTKVDARMKPHTSKMSVMKCMCLCCRKRESSLCKMCTLTKLGFYSRKERLSSFQQNKLTLAQDVENFCGELSELQSSLEAKRASIFLLKRKIDEKKALLKQRQNEIDAVDHSSKKAKTFQNGLRKFLEKHGTCLNGKEKLRKQSEIDRYQAKVADIRKKLALQILALFHIRQVKAETFANDSSDNTRWAVVSAPVREGMKFQICNSIVCDSLLDELKQRLTPGPSLQTSVMDLPHGLRSAFTAILHTVQLVKLLAILFDHRLSNSISFNKMCLCERWTDERLSDSWLKLCWCVQSLGLSMGVDADILHFDNPHSNLLEIGAHIFGDKVTQSPSAVLNDARHLEIQNANNQTEMSDWEVIPNCDP